MQLRVVTDQPWDVPADVLAIPIVGEPAFDGPLGEVDRRVGGELQSLVDSGGRLNDEVKAAFEAEKEAASHLPPDSKALVVILAEIGRGGLNQAVITIEQSRGELDSAIGLLGAPGASPSERPEP